MEYSNFFTEILIFICFFRFVKTVNLEFNGGKIYGFVGRNGSGKSVLLKMICGFNYSTIGQITLDREDYIGNNSFSKDTRALIEKPNFILYFYRERCYKMLDNTYNNIYNQFII